MTLRYDDVRAAHDRIRSHIIETPMIRLAVLDDVLGCEVYIKAECMQRTGSFKYRGAMNAMLSIGREGLASGVVAVSSGNHGRAVAYAARALGVRATVVLPDTVTPLKKSNIEALGADTVICPTAERFDTARRISSETGSVLIPPFDDAAIMAGQGTAGIEIASQCPELSAVVMPLSGGGLLAGVAAAIRHMVPSASIFGAEPAALPRYTASLASGEPVSVPAAPTVADALISLRPGVACFEVIRERVDKVLDVDDEYILKAARILTSDGKILAEPSSCIGIGAVMQGLVSFGARDKVCFLVTGGNASLEQLASL